MSAIRTLDRVTRPTTDVDPDIVRHELLSAVLLAICAMAKSGVAASDCLHDRHELEELACREPRRREGLRNPWE